MNIRVGIVTLSWNGASLLQSCLDALEKQTFQEFAVCVVDNGSTDNTTQIATSHKLGQKTIMIKNAKNQGYAKANNQGVLRLLDEYPDLEYIVLLNNDASPTPTWLQVLVKYMDKYPKVGLAQGANFTDQTMKIYDSTGIYLEEGFMPRQRASEMPAEHLELTSVGPNAAAVILRTDMIKDISYKQELLDGSFFAYTEDVDMILRAFSRGWEHAYVPKARAVHIGSATGNRVSYKKMYWGTRNLVWLVVKNAPLPVIKKKFKKILISHLANMEFLFKTNKRLFLSYAKGFMVGLTLAPMLLAKRRYIQKRSKVTSDDFLAILTPSAPPITNPIAYIRRKLHA